MSRVFLFCAAFFCCTALFLFSGCNKSNPAGVSSPTELEGTWKGYMVGEPGISLELRMQGNVLIYKYEGQEMYRATFTIDTSVLPHHLDGTITSSRINGYVGKTSLGIYWLFHDTLLVAGTEPGDPVRPKSFAPSAQNVVMRLFRQAGSPVNSENHPPVFSTRRTQMTAAAQIGLTFRDTVAAADPDGDGGSLSFIDCPGSPD